MAQQFEIVAGEAAVAADDIADGVELASVEWLRCRWETSLLLGLPQCATTRPMSQAMTASATRGSLKCARW